MCAAASKAIKARLSISFGAHIILYCVTPIPNNEQGFSLALVQFLFAIFLFLSYGMEMFGLLVYNFFL
jgi:hypothetical protein